MKKGTTLLELLLSVSIIVLLTTSAAPALRGLQIKNDLNIAVNSTVNSLRRAQVNSQAVDGDTSWGVSLQSSTITLFKGASYSARDSGFDEVYNLPGSITVGGLTEVVYSKFSGFPQTSGTLSFSSANNDSSTIIINSKGMLEY